MDKHWDAFISHASEDKSTIVRQLAEILEKIGIKIWYDEFSLKVGDSLSESIDNGLIKSKFGIVIISKDFLKKKWTDYEYRSLLSKEDKGKKIILPIWHNITSEEIRDFSLYLHDKFALNTSTMSINKLALTLTEQIRPDIYQNIKGYFLFKKILEKSVKSTAKLSELKPQKKPLSKLSKGLEVRARNIHFGVGQVIECNIDESIYNYELDLRPEREIQTWEIINLCYLEFTDKYKIKNTELKKSIIYTLINFSLGQLIEYKNITIEQQTELYELWKKYFYDY
ncbi:toll/interleukin-1 receptor domain-containing protein [Hymenobacter perfusus]|uniref:Toll/interleukin-1 receptor domain-containing protein n=1 Tax=Hymenobacter perfusus TaxID=1236770 RepID=A0A428K9T4_9BACT|nr:toll/interleukin-1 receptor domain-containing protein [Hymenobacter perfusus]RSK42968.1 toll/interleukin-1 receptor domain-containing protein [Hymenobacter perfusus]